MDCVSERRCKRKKLVNLKIDKKLPDLNNKSRRLEQKGEKSLRDMRVNNSRFNICHSEGKENEVMNNI